MAASSTAGDSKFPGFVDRFADSREWFDQVQIGVELLEDWLDSANIVGETQVGDQSRAGFGGRLDYESGLLATEFARRDPYNGNIQAFPQIQHRLPVGKNQRRGR